MTANKPENVDREPVGKVMTVGGYPDESEHTVEWLCKYKDLKDGDLLYTAPQPALEHPAAAAFSDYDPGRINDHGGGNVGWWQDYIRSEIEQANDFWRGQLESSECQPATTEVPEGEPVSAEQKLEESGVFKGADGLRSFAEDQTFWDGLPYSTRLYLSDGSYLHRDVVRAVVKLLDAPRAPQPAGPCRYHDEDAESCETYSGQAPCDPASQVVPDSVKNALSDLDKSYYRRWRLDFEDGDRCPSYVCGNINTVLITEIVEWARSLASPAPPAEEL